MSKKICSIIFLMIETEMSLNVCLIYHTTQGNSAVWSYLVLSKTSDILSIRTKSPFTRWFYFCILFFFLPLLNPSLPLFSYQYLSPSFTSLNWFPMIQENKGPTAAPSSGVSATPPANTSMSSTSLEIKIQFWLPVLTIACN